MLPAIGHAFYDLPRHQPRDPLGYVQPGVRLLRFEPTSDSIDTGVEADPGGTSAVCMSAADASRVVQLYAAYMATAPTPVPPVEWTELSADLVALGL